MVMAGSIIIVTHKPKQRSEIKGDSVYLWEYYTHVMGPQEEGLNVNPINMIEEGDYEGGIQFFNLDKTILPKICLWKMDWFQSAEIPHDATIIEVMIRKNGLDDEIYYLTDKIILGPPQKIDYAKYIDINGLYISYIENQVEDLCIRAVKQNGLAIQWIKYPTTEMHGEAVKQNGLALQHIQNQTLNLCNVALNTILLNLNMESTEFIEYTKCDRNNFVWHIKDERLEKIIKNKFNKYIIKMIMLDNYLIYDLSNIILAYV